jgi:hypothetical protein
MTDDKHKREGQRKMPAKNQKKAPDKDPGNKPRQDRLKQALRENLKRRKSQARGRSDVKLAPSDGDNVTAHDVGGKKPGE